jgi:hypothetical protein
MRDGKAVLPPEYADWEAQDGGRRLTAGSEVELSTTAMTVSDGDGTRSDSMETRRFKLVSPLDGDVYRVPPGVPSTYATIPLRVSGARRAVRWYVDGVAHSGSRWQLSRGVHLVRAEAGPNEVLEARITVE